MLKTKMQQINKAAQGRRFRRGLGARIVRSRQRRGWSQEKLADRLNVGRERLAKWEAGCHAPPAEALLALSEVLEVTVDELLTGRRLNLPHHDGGEASERSIAP